METAHESKTANIGSVSIVTQDSSGTEIRFSSDGTKMFMLGNLNDDIFRYDLAKAWVASSATFVSGSAIAPETNTFGFDINSDGTKYYIVGATEIIREYIPSVAYGTTLSTGTIKDIEWIMSLDAESIKFSNDGLRVFVCDAVKIYQFDLDTAFDISSLNMQYYNAGLEDSSPAAITFKPDGTRMIMAGAFNDTIRTYTLNFPWNISSATLINTSPVLADSAATGIAFNSDGSKFYTIGQGTTIDAIRQYNASNYAITSATVVKQIDLVNYSNPLGMAISHTGKQFFIITSSYDIIQLELDAAFEIDSIYIDQISESIDASPISFFVDKDGLRGLFFGSTGDTIRALSFSYKWNINGYTNSSTQSTVPGGTVTGIWWSDDGTQVLMADQVTDKIHRYTFGTAWNVTTISSTNSTKIYNLAHDLNPYSLAFNTDGTMMYYIDSGFVIRQIPLKTAYFPETAYSGTLITSGQDATPKSFCMNSTGSRLFLLGQTNDNIFRYDFGENYSVATLAYATSSVSISTRDSQGTGLECNSDASKFWLVGATNDTIYQLSN
jgi:sugar lactone lactonase YvrE